MSGINHKRSAMPVFHFEKATPGDALQVALIMAEAVGDDIMERTITNGGRIPETDKERMEKLCPKEPATS